MRVEIERATSGEPKLDGMYRANLFSDDGALIEWGVGVTIRVALDNLRSCVEDAEMDNLAWVEEAKAFLDVPPMADVVTNAREYLAQAGGPCWNEACVGYAATEHIVALLAEVERLRELLRQITA